MITVNVHMEGATLRNEVALDEIATILRREGDLLWVDVPDPTPEDLTFLHKTFGFHSLVLEDASRLHQRPKIDLFDHYFFLIFYAITPGAADGIVDTHQVSFFVGSTYVVTVHAGKSALLADTRQRWCDTVDEIGKRSIGLLVYTLLDSIVDGYFPVIDDLSDQIEKFEERLFARFNTNDQQVLFRLKKELLAVRKVVAPERDVLNVLLRRDTPMFDDATIVYFQDVYDHILRITDAVDTYRDLLSSALDVYLTITSNRLNQVMKTLTASSIILMSMTLVASVYGMNFVHMPELHWRLGYLWALGLMVAIGAGLVRLFRRIEWL